LPWGLDAIEEQVVNNLHLLGREESEVLIYLLQVSRTEENNVI